jgi:hypothetical protein
MTGLNERKGSVERTDRCPFRNSTVQGIKSNTANVTTTYSLASGARSLKAREMGAKLWIQ